MADNRVIKIDPDGNLQFLYHDDHPAMSLGEAVCKRASDVVWNNEAQGWEVRLRPPYDYVTIPAVFKRRQDAIDEEIRVLNQLMLGESM